MKINFTQLLLDLDGKPLKEAAPMLQDDGSTKIEVKTITLDSACSLALVAPDRQGGRPTPEEKKIECWQLALKIHNSTRDVELESKEVALIRERVARNPSPLIVGQVRDMLEDPEKGKESKSDS